MDVVLKVKNNLFNMSKKKKEAPTEKITASVDAELRTEIVTTEGGVEMEVEFYDEPVDIDGEPELTFEVTERTALTTPKSEYKSKIEYWVDVNKPIMAIYFDYYNLLSHKRLNEKTPIVDGIRLRGILNSDGAFIDNLTDFPPTLFDYTILFQIDGNEISFSMQAYKENGVVRNVIRMSSADIVDTKSPDLYNHLFKLALDSSNLKGSYMTISDNKLEWKVRELKDLSFNDVYLPQLLMDDLTIYTKLFKSRNILQRYMFSGIPGTGKTESTRAISKILNKEGVTIIKTNICDIIKQKFELAAILSPTLIILDDIDLYLGDRNSTGVSNLLGQFLDILDGVDKLPSDVGVIASTNAPHLIDLAAQRPGRFNKLLFFDELTVENIKSIILKSLKAMDGEFNNITDKDRNTLTQKALIDFFKKQGSTGAFIYEAVKAIKHKQDILGGEIILKTVIDELKANNETLDKKLNARTIKNKLSSSGGNGISF
jgi:hypothetical protein